MLIKQIHRQDSEENSLYEAFQACVIKEILLTAETLLTAHWHKTESMRGKGLCKKELSEVGLWSTVSGYLPYCYSALGLKICKCLQVSVF